MCRNCGHDCHCGSACKQTHKDGDGKEITIECCKECNCKHSEIKKDIIEVSKSRFVTNPKI